jgi:hypothetical protein
LCFLPRSELTEETCNFYIDELENWKDCRRRKKEKERQTWKEIKKEK